MLYILSLIHYRAPPSFHSLFKYKFQLCLDLFGAIEKEIEFDLSYLTKFENAA